MEVAAIPFPSAERPPPVTKICLVLVMALPSQEFFSLDYIARGIHTQDPVGRFDHLDPMTVLQGPQLLQPFQTLQTGGLHLGEFQKEIPPVSGDSDMLQKEIRSLMRTGCPGKVESKAILVRDHFVDVSVH